MEWCYCVCTLAHVGSGTSSPQREQRRLSPPLHHPPTPILPSLSQLHRPVSQSMAGLSGPAKAPAHGGVINKLLAPFCQL